jgi:hypothetical protein
MIRRGRRADMAMRPKASLPAWTRETKKEWPMPRPHGRPRNMLRQAARDAGEKTFLAATPCSCGGQTRYVSNGACTECVISKAKERYHGLDDAARARQKVEDHRRYAERRERLKREAHTRYIKRRNQIMADRAKRATAAESESIEPVDDSDFI